MSNTRMSREKKTIRAMIQLYCTQHHVPNNSHQPIQLCPDCHSLYEYALHRLDHCPFQNAKPTCGQCPIHCYQPEQRVQIKTIMRYAGPRMLLRHPLLAIAHLIDRVKSTQRTKCPSDTF